MTTVTYRVPIGTSNRQDEWEYVTVEAVTVETGLLVTPVVAGKSIQPGYVLTHQPSGRNLLPPMRRYASLNDALATARELAELGIDWTQDYPVIEQQAMRQRAAIKAILGKRFQRGGRR